MSALNNKLSYHLLKFYGKDNTTVSPYSLLSCFNLLWKGLSSSSLQEVNNVFIGSEQQHIDLYKLNKIFQAENSLEVCNFLLTRNDLYLQKTYLQKMNELGNHEYFSTNQLTELVEKVNTLVEQNTNGLIKNLLSSEDINDDTIFVLLNTIYFKSDWSVKFPKKNTREMSFRGLQCTRKESFMHVSDKYFRYYENKDYQMLEMCYKNNQYAFGVVLPKDIYSHPILLDHENLEHSVSHMHSNLVNVTLPKFTQESENDLIPFFKSLGINKIFNNMDIDNMIQKSELSHNCRYFVSVIKQKVKIVVNEDGTEASAATVIVGELESCRITQQKPIEFVADHPFSYYLRHIPSNVILFSGTFV